VVVLSCGFLVLSCVVFTSLVSPALFCFGLVSSYVTFVVLCCVGVVLCRVALCCVALRCVVSCCPCRVVCCLVLSCVAASFGSKIVMPSVPFFSEVEVG
jgi:hypothetical protein